MKKVFGVLCVDDGLTQADLVEVHTKLKGNLHSDQKTLAPLCVCFGRWTWTVQI